MIGRRRKTVMRAKEGVMAQGHKAKERARRAGGRLKSNICVSTGVTQITLGTSLLKTRQQCRRRLKETKTIKHTPTKAGKNEHRQERDGQLNEGRKDKETEMDK